MARISGVELPRNKTIEFALPHIFGIGQVTARQIVRQANIDPRKKVADLSDDEVTRIRKEIETNFKVEGALRAEITSNIKRYIEIGSYRGMRHRAGLPVRGQRTRTNARTRRGRRGTTIGIKKKAKKA